MKKTKLYFGMVENIVGKGEKAGYQHFIFSHNAFKALCFRFVLTDSHTMTPFDAPGKPAF